MKIELFRRFHAKFGAPETTGTPVKAQNKKSDFSRFFTIYGVAQQVAKISGFPNSKYK